ncbi:MAG: hypothetical protein R3C17_18445 [Planctomycetaceae bacterium]
MCGFAAVINLNHQTVDIDVIRAMTDSLRHRGPDDQAFGLYSLSTGEFRVAARDDLGYASAAFPTASTAVGFNRLSIQDTSSRGRQPMSSSCGRKHIVFNGEIYNAPQLREQMVREGVVFRSNSDTEVILNLYQRAGMRQMLSRLNGMFAICIIDLDRRSLMVAGITLASNLFIWLGQGKQF